MSTYGHRLSLVKPQLLWRVDDVSQHLRISKRTVYSMVAQNRIPYLKPPGTNLLRFEPEAIFAWERGKSSK